MRKLLSIMILVILSFNGYCQELNSKTIERNDSLLLKKYLHNLSLRNTPSQTDLKRTDYSLDIINTNDHRNFKKPGTSQWLKGFPQSTLSLPNYGGPNYDLAPLAFRRNRIPFSTWIRQYDYLNH